MKKLPANWSDSTNFSMPTPLTTTSSRRRGRGFSTRVRPPSSGRAAGRPVAWRPWAEADCVRFGVSSTPAASLLNLLGCLISKVRKTSTERRSNQIAPVFKAPLDEPPQVARGNKCGKDPANLSDHVHNRCSHSHDSGTCAHGANEGLWSLRVVPAASAYRARQNSHTTFLARNRIELRIDYLIAALRTRFS